MPTKIQFACPNGHKLAAAGEGSGPDVTCPKCKTTFPVPAVGRGSAIAEAKSTNSPAPVPVSEEVIVFLCPNNHKLNGPASLQGQPGQCPHCGAKFRIPLLEDYEEEQEEFPLGTMVEDDPDEVLDVADEVEILEETPPKPLPMPLPVEEEPPRTTATAPAPTGPHPLAKLLRSYWSGSGKVRLRLHLHGGNVLEPDRYSESQSTLTHGVFAVKGEEDTWDVVAVAWDAVERFDFRGLKTLPPDEFK